MNFLTINIISTNGVGAITKSVTAGSRAARGRAPSAVGLAARPRACRGAGASARERARAATRLVGGADMTHYD